MSHQNVTDCDFSSPEKNQLMDYPVPKNVPLMKFIESIKWMFPNHHSHRFAKFRPSSPILARVRQISPELEIPKMLKNYHFFLFGAQKFYVSSSSETPSALLISPTDRSWQVSRFCTNANLQLMQVAISWSIATLKENSPIGRW